MTWVDAGDPQVVDRRGRVADSTIAMGSPSDPARNEASPLRLIIASYLRPVVAGPWRTDDFRNVAPSNL